MTASLTYSGIQAKLHDPDRYFLSLLVPRERQPDIWPLLAFNYEIARTREVVTDTNIGLIRLQWWRDALAQIFSGGTCPENEVALALEKIIKTYDLPLTQFESLIYAREFDLEDVSPATLEGLVHYADYTHTPLLHLIQHVLGESEECRGTAISYTMAGLMNSIIFHARQRRSFLPTDMVGAAKIDLGTLYELKPDADLPSVVEEICNQASLFLFASEPRSKFLKGMNKMTALYLKRMKGCGYDPFNKKWIKPIPFQELRVALAAR